MLTTFILLLELIVSVVALIWIVAMLGFADESHRNTKAGFSGKMMVASCLLFAFLPLAATGWIGLRNYFFEAAEKKSLLIWWLPLVVLLICVPVCMGIIYLYDASFKKKK